MIYKIDSKYYVNISPSVYVEIHFEISNKDVVIKPTNNKKEVNSNDKIVAIDFSKEKENIKKKLSIEKTKSEIEKPKIINDKSKNDNNKSFLGRRTSKRW